MAIGALFGVVAVAAIASSGATAGSPAAASFRLPDGSAGCNFRDTGEIACRAVGNTAARVLRPDGSSRADRDAEVAWDDSTQVLLASESWWNGTVSCRVSGPRIICASGDGSIAVGAATDGRG